MVFDLENESNSENLNKEQNILRMSEEDVQTMQDQITAEKEAGGGDDDDEL